MAFRLDGQLFGFEIERVREILQMVEITPVPDAPAHVRGAINVRGRVVPILDLRMILGMPERRYGLHTPIVLIEGGERLVGMAVDDVSDVVTVDSECFEAPADNYPMTAVMSAVCKLDTEMLMLFDPDRLIGAEELPEDAITAGEA